MELFVGINTGAEPLCVGVHLYIVNIVWNKLQTYCDGRFNMVVHFFIHLTTRPSANGKRAPLTAISLQAVGSPKEAPPTYIAKMW